MKTNKKGIIIPDYLIFAMYLEKDGRCASDLFRDLDITYKHIHEIKHTFMDLGWLTIEKENRRQNMFLTSQGKELLSIAKQLLSFMNLDFEDILKYIQKGKIKKKEKVDGKQLLKDITEDFKDDNGQILLY